MHQPLLDLGRTAHEMLTGTSIDYFLAGSTGVNYRCHILGSLALEGIGDRTSLPCVPIPRFNPPKSLASHRDFKQQHSKFSARRLTRTPSPVPFLDRLHRTGYKNAYLERKRKIRSIYIHYANQRKLSTRVTCEGKYTGTQ